MTKDRKILLNVTVRQSVLEKIEDVSYTMRISKSQAVENALVYYLENHPKQ